MNNRNKKFEFDITFFVPCYNEEKNIQNTINALISSLKKFNLKFEIIIVDDCSTDNTNKIIKEIIESNIDLNIELITNNKNKGLGMNYVDTAFIAKGENYMLINGDNAEPE